MAQVTTTTNGVKIEAEAICDVNTVSLTGDWDTIIKYVSSVDAAMQATAQKGAAIDESLYIMRCGEQTGYSFLHTFNNVESNVITFSAEDSRGNIGTAKITLNMIDYILPTCNISDNRPDGDGDVLISCTGDFFNGSFGAVTNTLTAQYRYKVSGGAWSDWKDMTVSPSGNSYYASAFLTGLNYQQTYVFEAKVTDALKTATDTSSPVKSIPVFHWGENDFAFEVPVSFNGGVVGDLNITGDLRLNGTELPTLQYGYWYPTLDSSAVYSYTTQNGWYTKMGQNVTIGFFVKAYCLGGYESTQVQISGLPFTPMASAAGGGMCSGAYVSGGFTFQCFVAEASGYITTRVQGCNHTSATMLSTSASGCGYRLGGGEITLSGTITYMANS